MTSHSVIVEQPQNIVQEATEQVRRSERPRSRAHNQIQSVNSSREEDETTDTTAPAGRRTISAPIERLTWLPRFMAFKKLSSPSAHGGHRVGGGFGGPGTDLATLLRPSARPTSRPYAAPNRQEPNCNFRYCFRHETLRLACFLLFCFQLIALSQMDRAESSPKAGALALPYGSVDPTAIDIIHGGPFWSTNKTAMTIESSTWKLYSRYSLVESS